MLMGEVERAAHETGVKIPVVPSSITAEPFYSRLGFKAVRDRLRRRRTHHYHGAFLSLAVDREPPLLMCPIDGWSAEARFRPRLMSLTSLRDQLLKIGAKVISHGRYVTFQVGRGCGIRGSCSKISL